MGFLKIILLPVLKSIMPGGAVSFGRGLLLATFGMMIWKWGVGKECPETMMMAFYVFTGYVFGTKAVDMAKDVIPGSILGKK